MQSLERPMRYAARVCLAAGILLAPAMASAETLTVLAGPIEPYAIETGARHGAAVELVTEMAKRAGVELALKFEPWARAQADAQAGKDVAILPLTRTVEREPKYAWIAPLLSDEVYLQTIRPELDIATLEKARPLNVATLRSTPQEDELRRAGATRLELTSDEDTCAKMLKAGRVDAWFTRGMVGAFTYAKNGGDPHQLRRGAAVATAPMYLGGSPEFSAPLAAKLNEALQSMHADGSYDRIMSAYQ
jgi:polar amino acid transport system substrate-binding protein